MYSISSRNIQKIADFHSAAEPTVSDDSDNEANRWAKAVVALTPILSKGINSLTGWLEKSRVKPRHLAFRLLKKKRNTSQSED